MSEPTSKSPRIRGQKEREAAYRAGFCDGLAHAMAEMRAQHDLEQARDLAIHDGFARLREAPLMPKRTRRGRGGSITSGTIRTPEGVAANPAVPAVP